MSNKVEVNEELQKGLAGLAAYTNMRSIHPEKDKAQGKIINLNSDQESDNEDDSKNTINQNR